MKDEYYKTKESVKEYIESAKDVSGIQLIEKLKQHLNSKSTILEIGSGPGTDWNILNETYEKVVGSDNSNEFLDHLKSENPMGNFLELDAASISTDLTFDGIYSNKVLHHLTDQDLIKSFERQYEILGNEGVICHSFWYGEESEIFKGLFVNYHTEEDIKKVCASHFEILLMERYQEFEKDDSVLLIAKKL